jgi:enoyl-CoA hydratase
MKTFENLLFTCQNGVCTITLNRPDKLNALNKKTVIEIGEALRQAQNDSTIHGIIITGSGPKAFAAGADISEFLGLTPEQGKAMAGEGQAVFKEIENSFKPVIAAVNGFALGGGCELAMACHLRVASENAKFGQPEVNLGLLPGYGGTQRLNQYVGKSKATELLLTADLIGAQEALQLGLVNHVTSVEALFPKCLEIMDKLRTKSPLALAGVIRTVNAYYTEGVDGFNQELVEFGKCFGTDDFKEGTTAFLEKRKPVFSGAAGGSGK